MKSAIALVTAFILVGALPARGGDDRSVTVRLDAASTLPGLPTGAVVTFHNKGSEVLRLRKDVRIALTSEPDRILSSATTFSVESQDIEVAPHSKLTLWLGNTISLIGPNVFCDSRLSLPGKYEVRFSFETVDGWSLFSEPVTLVVEDPKGADLKVWELLKGLGEEPFTCRAWAKYLYTTAPKIYEQYPDSNYVPYIALGVTMDTEGRISVLRDVLERFPKSPQRELVRMELAPMLHHLGENPKNKGHEEFAKEARELIDQLKKSDHPGVRSNTADAFE